MMRHLSSRSGAPKRATTHKTILLTEFLTIDITSMTSLYGPVTNSIPQYQTLADKYAPSTDPDIQSTLAALQLRPDLKRQQSISGVPLVPLPPRLSGDSKQATAEAIRDGRRASQLLATLKGWTRSAEDSTSRSASIASRSSKNIQSLRRGASSSTTFYEQDFTVPGKKSQLLCPFVQKLNHLRRISTTSNSNTGDKSMMTDRKAARRASAPDMEDNTPHHSADPICAALYAETHVSAPPSAAGSNKCPIRFLDQHSPEEIAAYFETHKHEIPRSHEVCVKRYQRSEGDVRKLDAKYGNDIVNMLQGLGQKHQPMLPKDEELQLYADPEEEKKTNKRVENWAKNVSNDGIDSLDPAEAATSPMEGADDDRESRFDRQMKEVRVGESPSRPWGISVPWNQPDLEHYGDDEAPNSPPAAPVIANFHAPATAPQPSRQAGGCPFSNMGGPMPAGHVPVAQQPPEPPHPTVKDAPNIQRPTGKCPFGHTSKPEDSQGPKDLPTPQYSSQYQPRYDAPPKSDTFTTSNVPPRSETFATSHMPPVPEHLRDQGPTFLAPPQYGQPGMQFQHQQERQGQGGSTGGGGSVVPQMVFNGPVFIGYPVDQAMMLMQQWQAGMR